ncbi:MAG: type VI secretion system accessory protein TagJ [Gemmataceae bacterium]
MTASELLETGKLQGAIDAQVREVKSDPADAAKRLFLFELLAFAGDLDRARRQMDAIHYDELELEAARMAYRNLLDAEQARRRVMQEGIAPQFFGEVPAHGHLRLQALNRLRDGVPAEAASLLNQADAVQQQTKGEINDKPFDTFRDCDDVFSGILEVMAHGNYYWVPFEQIDTLTMNPPRYPRDLLWIPARLALRDGPTGDVFLPALYPGSHEHAEDAVRLGRKTDWKPIEGGPVLGKGLHTYLAGDDDYGLLDCRSLRFI